MTRKIGISALPATVTLAVALAVLPPPAMAGPPVPAPLAAAVAGIEADGYVVVDTRRSWLGRFVVLAIRDGQLREVVLNRATGSVVSDRLFDAGDAPETMGKGNGTGGNGRGNGQAGR